MESRRKDSDPKVFVGIDWATEHHDACAVDLEGRKLAEGHFAHSGEGLAELCCWLERLSALDEIIVGLEVNRGPVVETLLQRGVRIFALNPKKTDRFRDRFSVAGAKSDQFDARVIADSLRTDRGCFREVRCDDPLVVELRAWSRAHDDLQANRVALRNQIWDQLWRYYPQFLKLSKDLTSEWMLALWLAVPSPATAKKVKEKAIQQLLKRHHVRSITSSEVLTELRKPELRVAPGVVPGAVATLTLAVERMQILNRQLKTAAHELDRLCKKMAEEETPREEEHKGGQCDVKILSSLPGVGRIVLATLLAEAHQPLKNRDYHALRALSGVAPVTRGTGKRNKQNATVLMRRACDMRLREAMFHWARTALQHNDVCKAKYAALRKRNQSHARALRTIGDRLLKVACAMLRAGTEFDPSHVPAPASRRVQPLP